MIQSFSVENFLSFNTMQTISFEPSVADKSNIEELSVEVKAGVRVLKLGVLYGANASGKSNLLCAMSAMWSLMSYAQIAEHKTIAKYLPFKLNVQKPTYFKCLFWANERQYSYEIRFNSSRVLYEKLTYTSDSDVSSLMYERLEDGDIKFGGTLNIKAKVRSVIITNTLANHTILSIFNKINVDVPLLRELYDWIENNVHLIDGYKSLEKIAEEAMNDGGLKDFILDVINRADFNIVDFNIINTTLPKRILESILKSGDIDESLKARITEGSKQLVFTHKVDASSFELESRYESDGTDVYFRLARVLYDLHKNTCVCLEDEIEGSLHYDLLVHYLKTFLENSNKSQLIVSTHEQSLLDESWMIRRDMVWLVDKGRKNAESVLKRASKMGLHKNLSLKNAYEIGKMGAKPILGSTLIARNNEE